MRVLIFRNTSFCKRFRVGGFTRCQSVSVKTIGNLRAPKDRGITHFGAIFGANKEKVREMAARFSFSERGNQSRADFGDDAYTQGMFRNYRHAANICKAEGLTTDYEQFILKARIQTKARKARVNS